MCVRLFVIGISVKLWLNGLNGTFPTYAAYILIWLISIAGTVHGSIRKQKGYLQLIFRYRQRKYCPKFYHNCAMLIKKQLNNHSRGSHFFILCVAKSDWEQLFSLTFKSSVQIWKRQKATRNTKSKIYLIFASAYSTAPDKNVQGILLPAAHTYKSRARANLLSFRQKSSLRTHLFLSWLSFSLIPLLLIVTVSF